MSDDQFTKLFKAIQEVKADVHVANEKLDTMATKDEMYQRFDDIAARLDIDDTERAAVEAQVNRHEGWINQLADNTGTDLAVEA
jgi:ribosome-associated translation inhibitor RaiA